MTKEHDARDYRLDGRKIEFTALMLEVVNEDGERTNLVFPMFDRDKALRALMQFANAPDMNFVSLAKRNA